MKGIISLLVLAFFLKHYLCRGHDEIIEKVDKAIASNAQGLFLGGNFKGGVSFGDCIKNGAQIADNIGGFLMKT